MVMIEWNESLELGIDIIDSQHRRLISIINETERAERGEAGSMSTTQLLNELLDYIVEHFLTEEELMRRYEYADYNNHKSAHDSAAKRLFDWDTSAGSDRESAKALLCYLVHWMENHLMKEDRALADFLIAKGQPEA